MTEAAMPLSEDDIALAGELAMRLLAPAEEAQARARITRDSAFAEEVLRWEERLMPLADDLAGVPAPDHVWGKITAQIAPAAAQDRSGTLRFWQGLSFVSTAAAAALALMLVNQPAPVPVQPSAPMIAALSAEGGKEIGRASCRERVLLMV